MATRYTELALDGANLYIVNRIRKNLETLNKSKEDATKELFLTAFKDYSKLDDSLAEIDKKLTSDNGITMLKIMKKSFSINFMSALNKTLDKLGYKNDALEILKDTTKTNTNFSKINSEQINFLMNYWNLKNDRYDENDFDGGHFSGDFDTSLNDMGYVRLCVERKDGTPSMVIAEKEKLDSLIKENFSTTALYEAETSAEEYLDAYYDVYSPILKNLGIDTKYYDNSNYSSMYVDGVDYILEECGKLGYKFGQQVQEDLSIEESKKIVEEHSSNTPSSALQVK